jgi:hypothetical protein
MALSFDLCFRHALDIDDTGERLAFGSTTGTLPIEPSSAHIRALLCVRRGFDRLGSKAQIE